MIFIVSTDKDKLSEKGKKGLENKLYDKRGKTFKRRKLIGIIPAMNCVKYASLK